MALVELGRFDRMEAHMVCAKLEAAGLYAIVFDGEASIADGSQFLIPARVMIDDEDEVEARAIIGGAA
jgi:Putative prokaryotic signal transducing protein